MNPFKYWKEPHSKKQSIFQRALPPAISYLLLSGYIHDIRNSNTVPTEIINLVYLFYGTHKRVNYLNNKKSLYDGPSISISLGNQNICIAEVYADAIIPKIISNHDIHKTIPLYISFNNTSNSKVFGIKAKNQLLKNPKNTIFNLHQLIGKQIDNINITHYPFKIISDNNHNPLIQVEYNHKTKIFTIQQLYAMIFSYIKFIASKNSSSLINVKNAIISVPSYFTDHQKEIIRDAADSAGLTVMDIIKDSFAVIKAYDIKLFPSIPQKIFIFNFGATSLTLTLSEISDGITRDLITVSYKEYGGNDIDKLILNHFLKDVQRKYKLDIRHNKRGVNKLLSQCQIVKHILSTSENANLAVDCLINDIDYTTTLSRARFEYLCRSYFDECIQETQQFLIKNNINPIEIKHVILCGGSSQIPYIQKGIINIVPSSSNKHYCWKGDEVSAIGASKIAIGSQMTNQYKNVSTDGIKKIALNIGIETQYGIMTNILTKTDYFSSSEEESQRFTTSKDYQKGVLIKIYEGQRIFVKDNYYLGEFEFIFNNKEMSSQLRGVQSIDVIMRIDHDHVLRVTARDIEDIYNKQMIELDLRAICAHYSSNLAFRSKAKARVNLHITKAKLNLIQDTKRYKLLQSKVDLQQFAFQIKNRLNKTLNCVNQILIWSDNNDGSDVNQYEKKQNYLENKLKSIIFNDHDHEEVQLPFDQGPRLPFIDDGPD